MIFVLSVIPIVIGTYTSIYVLYYLMLFVAHFLIKDKEMALHAPRLRFGIIIPAFNEELLLERCLKSVNCQNYPSDMFKTIVIADNCTDKTAQIGLNNRAIVLERFDNQYRGKGYAIKYGLERIDIKSCDAILIIDADSIISKDVLGQLNQAILEGNTVIQCYNSIANPDESWFTRLLDISQALGNEIYHPAKRKLGLSSCLMGTGMCFSTKIFLKYGWDAFSVGEDWEYYARLIEEGENVFFAKNARVFHQESSSLKQATSQRLRWSSGRFAIAWKYGFRIFYRGLIERNIRKVDASFPLILPNPSLGINIIIIGIVLSFLLPLGTQQYSFIIWFCSLALVQFLIFMIGITYTHNKLTSLFSLLVAPVFLFWKMGIDLLSAFGFGRQRWVRTERKL